MPKWYTDQEAFIQALIRWEVITLGVLAAYCQVLFSANASIELSVFGVVWTLFQLGMAVRSIIVYHGTRGYIILIYVVELLVQLVLAFAILYHSMVIIYPKSFSNFHTLSSLDALYYSVYTFADYGTLSPVTTLAKWVVMSEMMLTFFAGTFVMSVLVTIFLRTKE